MAVVSVSFDGTRLSSAESETDGGTWDEWDAAKSPTQETDIVYQQGASNAAISLKVGTSESGVEFEDSSTEDLSTTPKFVLFKIWVTNIRVLNNEGSTGAVLYIGSGTTTDRYNYYMLGGDSYPPRGGWQFLAIDPNLAGYRDATDGSPALGSADYYAISCTFSAASKTDNVVMDAVDICASGSGLTLTGGTSTDPDGTFQDFVDEDEGTVANRWAVVYTEKGQIFCNAVLTIGSATETDFTDSNTAVTFAEHRLNSGATGLKIGLQNASSVISITDCSFFSVGRGWAKDFFGTTADVDGTNDVLTLDASKAWADGDYVLYSKEGGTVNMGLTDATNYWIAWDATNSGWAVYSSRQNAMTDTSRINLTSTGSENHTLSKVYDTRADLTVTGTSGTLDLTGSAFVGFRDATLTSAVTAVDCKFVGLDQVDAGGGADLSGSTVSQCTTEVDTGAVVWNNALDPDGELDDMTISKGTASHHAIDFGTSVTSNITLRGIEFTGFGSTDDADDSTVRFLATSGSLNLTLIGCTVGGAVASASNFSVDDAAGITVTPIYDPVTTLVHVDDNAGADLQNARVYLKAADGTGPYPYQESVTISRSGTTATVTHTAHGMASNDIVKIEGITDKTEDNNGTHQITVTGANAYTYTTTDSGSTSYTGTITSTWVMFNGLTDVNGDISDSRNLATAQPVDGFVRKSTASPRFKTFTLGGSISATAGLTINVRLVLDE